MKAPGRAVQSGRLWRCALLLAVVTAGQAFAERPMPQRDLLIELREADSSPTPAPRVSGRRSKCASATAAAPACA